MHRWLLTAGTLALASATTHAATVQMDHIFPLPNIPNYPPEEMIANVGGEFEDAMAWATFTQGGGSTQVKVNVVDAAPNMFFTVWLKLDEPSPLTGAAVTALANPSDTADLGAVTPMSALTPEAMALGLMGDAGRGDTNVANGFTTDATGAATFTIMLDYALEPGGAFPFDAFHHSLDPVPFGDSPFALRLASHAVDQVGHGLVPGKHEMWFDTVTLPTPSTGLALALPTALLARRRR